MSRKPRSRRIERPAIRLFPSLLMGFGTLAGGLLVLALGLFAIPRDGWSGLVWTIPGFYVMLQPIQGFVRGKDDQLRLGLRTINLADLQKVSVHDRKNWGLRYSVVSLQMSDHVQEINGLFLSTDSFTQLVLWLKVPTRVIDGLFSARQFAERYPHLLPSRPPRPENQGKRPKR